MTYSLSFRTLHTYSDSRTGIGVPVVLTVGKNKCKTLANLDTGASYCIFKREHGEELGLDIESGVRQEIGTATEPFLTYGHTVLVAALGFEVEVTIYFAARVGLPRNVLGRSGWIEQLRLGIVDYDRELYVGHYNEEKQ
jgi:hypothetical protein